MGTAGAVTGERPGPVAGPQLGASTGNQPYTTVIREQGRHGNCKGQAQAVQRGKGNGNWRCRHVSRLLSGQAGGVANAGGNGWGQPRPSGYNVNIRVSQAGRWNQSTVGQCCWLNGQPPVVHCAGNSAFQRAERGHVNWGRTSRVRQASEVWLPEPERGVQSTTGTTVSFNRAAVGYNG